MMGNLIIVENGSHVKTQIFHNYVHYKEKVLEKSLYTR